MAGNEDFSNWSREQLIEKIKLLEHKAQPLQRKEERVPSVDDGASQPQLKKQKRDKQRREIDPSKYSTRHVALKLAYLGKRFAGFEHQPSAEQPTIESELWRALATSRLIMPADMTAINFFDDALDYAKCGRTDKGVSAFGQVVSIRLRSNRPVPQAAATAGAPAGDDDVPLETGSSRDEARAAPEFDDLADEIDYCGILNRLLPPEIRVLAWCPKPPEGFSARFSCQERAYRYFFTQPAFPPLLTGAETSGGAAAAVKSGWLDIAAMQEGAKLFVGEHDFRNFCKVDGGKQITNFKRWVLDATIEEVSGVDSAVWYLNQPEYMPSSTHLPKGDSTRLYPKVYSFNVRGTAFLWHQIRHMVGILFLVGQGLEQPSIVSELLDVDANPGRPDYHLAEDVPLVLWDCKFPTEGDQAVKWTHVADGHPTRLPSTNRMMESLWENWREAKVDEILANQLLNLISQQKIQSVVAAGIPRQSKTVHPLLFEGGNKGTACGKYVPVMSKSRLEPPEVQNDKWAKRKGFANSQAMRESGNWLQAIRDAKQASNGVKEE